MLSASLFLDPTPRVAYFNDPRIHNLGNRGIGGSVHALLARPFTSFIDTVAYRENVRASICKRFSGEQVVDLCCGTGASTVVGGIGIDTSPEMLREARWRRGPTGRFFCANAEEWGRTDCCDVVTIFFALHEIPKWARHRILANAQRIARKRVVVCDISPAYAPSPMMLSGEPWLLDYQEHIRDELVQADENATLFEYIPGRVFVGVLCSAP